MAVSCWVAAGFLSCLLFCSVFLAVVLFVVCVVCAGWCLVVGVVCVVCAAFPGAGVVFWLFAWAASFVCALGWL